VLSLLCDCCRHVKCQTLTNENLLAEFYFNLEKTASETYRMLKKAFSGNTVSRTLTFVLCSRFKWPNVS
jgi:hypothetical protein